MGFGENLVFLRKMRNQMSQEELAEKIGVSRQTVSKWELNSCYPELNKVMELCHIFSCSMDEIVQKDMNVCEDAFSNIREEDVEAFQYLRYAVVSMEPEEDAQSHVKKWADSLKIDHPTMIGWDFPVVSQEQINVFHMHGYAAALILPENFKSSIQENMEVIKQKKQKYVAITIKNPFSAPFRIIPNAYKTLMYHIQINQLSSKEPQNVISCFEKVYEREGIPFMDVYMAIENSLERKI